MNEKEMIEEMAKDTGCCDYPQRKCNNCWCKEKRECSAYGYAKTYYEKGYRKISEGSVVLTSEQYSNYLILQTNHEFIREKAKELQADNERLYKNLGKFKESVRKETAKEILKAVLEDIGEFYAGDIVEELAKKYGVEVEE